MDQAARFTAEHTVMEAGIEIRELKHLLEVAEDRIKKLEKENAKLKASQKQNEDPTSLVLNFDEPLHSCLLYTSPSPRDNGRSRMPSAA